MDFKEVFKTTTKEFEETLFQHKELNELVDLEKIRKKLNPSKI